MLLWVPDSRQISLTGLKVFQIVQKNRPATGQLIVVKYASCLISTFLRQQVSPEIASSKIYSIWRNSLNLFTGITPIGGNLTTAAALLRDRGFFPPRKFTPALTIFGSRRRADTPPNLPYKFQNSIRANPLLWRINSNISDPLMRQHSMPFRGTKRILPAPVFQLKPGYSALWRSYRRHFAATSPLRYFRQRRWTNYFLSISRISGYSLILNLEFSLQALLQGCWNSVYSAISVLSVIRAGFIYVGGSCVRNPQTQVYVGDPVQWVVPSPMFQVFRYFEKHMRQTSLFSGVAVPKFRDIPNYLEVDFFSGSLCILYNPAISEINFQQTPPHLTMRLYNWKFII